MDFFTPVVDDPYAFGQIAAANALSDIYAMGARPITALNLVGFPISRLPHAVLAAILQGGADKAREAGCIILGGHSIDDVEPKYGLAVTGVIHPDRLATKGGARPGDQLVVTKPIGTGTITTAIKSGVTPPEVVAEAVAVMARLNNVVEALHPFGIRGMTDITGFGLLGHARELAAASGCALSISAAAVPVLPAAWEYAARDIFPGGTRKNFQWLAPYVEYAASLDEATRMLLCDAVTSGGLLLAVPPAHVETVVNVLREHELPAAAVIGECVAGHPGSIQVLP